MGFHVPNQFRVRRGQFASDDSYGNAGLFIWGGGCGRTLRAIASDGEGWEHVSVSIDARGQYIPNWVEMCETKAFFWDAEDVVMQLHPAESEYVNHHPGCLHLWRPIGIAIPTPPSWMVGPKAEAPR